ncbi:LuxR family transcriptional regulator [Nocardioides marinquilinus]|uniref:LuxR family transcriptional regulator n=1 Tax=Nocardioides marinquilinus TaxID=1210400 RepID=A0ABP9Q5Y8_9ACTN
MLEAVGVGADDEEVYRALLQRPEVGVAALADAVGRAEGATSASLARLERLGFVTWTSEEVPRPVATRPDVAVEVLVSGREAELDRARAAGRELLAEMALPGRYRPERLVEVVVGRQAIAARFAQLLSTTTSELLVLDRPPYATGPGEADARVRGLLAEGAVVRGIYSPDSLSLPGAVEEAHSAVEAGERSRLHPEVPMKLAVSDRREALLPLAVDQLVDSALVVHASALLDALVQMFDLLWDQAVPLVEPTEPAGDPRDGRLLTMLTAGLQDDVIARQLGVSTRTVGRRVAALLETLGARTRFQAGVLSGRRSR